MIPKEEIVAEIHRLADGNSPPTKREFHKKSKHSSTTVWHKFGSWNEALIKAGYQPNNRKNIPKKLLLKKLNKETSGEVAPPYEEFDGQYHPKTYSRQFGSWWQACVQAGLNPPNRRPLTTKQSQKFFEASVDQQHAENQLIGLLTQFTGLTLHHLPKLSESWVTIRNTDMIIKVPSTETQSNSHWTFRVPATWTDRNQQRETELPELLKWYLRTHESIDKTPMGIRNTVFKIADDANLRNRECVHRTIIGTVPLIRPIDLRTTGGIQMARNSISPQRIRRHLGVKHTGWRAQVDDFFLWLYVHENFVHPNYDSPDAVLDPVSS